MTPIERVEAVLGGGQPDRPPFSFWHHFAADQVAGPAAVQAHLDLLNTYDLDFIKVMNDNGYPHSEPIRSVEDLSSLAELRGDEEPFSKQLDLISSLRAATRGRVMLTTTIFNAWSVLRQLVQPPKTHKPPNLDALADAPSRWIRDAWRDNPTAVEKALQIIGRSLARFASRCLAAGADGIFLSVRQDWVDIDGRQNLYQRLVRPTDLHILASASRGRFNMLHVCGRPIDLRQFNDYPVHAINWADRAAGPSIAQAKDWLKPAICGGVDNLGTLPNGSAADVAREVADALKQAGARPMIVTPGCTFDPLRVPQANLHAIAQAVRERPNAAA